MSLLLGLQTLMAVIFLCYTQVQMLGFCDCVPGCNSEIQQIVLIWLIPLIGNEQYGD